MLTIETLIEATPTGDQMGDMWSAADLPPGYHGTCWWRATPLGTALVDRDIPASLRAFLSAVARMAEREGSDRRVGAGYVRVIDGAAPENYMAWHVDNPDQAERYHLTLATDGAPVHLAFLDPAAGAELVGQPVESTHQLASYRQPPNGTLVRFTTEPHGVLPQPARPGAKTIIFFATLYRNRQEADLYTTNNTSTGQHGTLPTLEGTRYDIGSD